MFLLTDDEEEALDLPRRYGVDDLPVVVQDKDVRANGNLGNGTGRTIVVNGTPGPYAEVSSERVRLRLLNAATMRVMDFRFDDGGEFDLVATDGGLLPRPTKLRHLRMSPGERAEVVVSLRPGERRVLQSVQPDLGGNVLSNHFDGGAASFDVLELRAADRLTPAPPVPDVLSTSNLATAGGETDDVVRRSFELNGRQINGRSMDMARVDSRPRSTRPSCGRCATSRTLRTTSTSTTCSSGSCPSTAGHRLPSTPGCTTPSTCRRRWSSASSCGSPTTATPSRPTWCTATCCATRTRG
jgi:FtsP/CotA-like multicopper oxidase with cupredoxin domain